MPQSSNLYRHKKGETVPYTMNNTMHAVDETPLGASDDPVSFENYIVAYLGILVMALFPIWYGSYSSITKTKEKVSLSTVQSQWRSVKLLLRERTPRGLPSMPVYSYTFFLCGILLAIRNKRTSACSSVDACSYLEVNCWFRLSG